MNLRVNAYYEHGYNTRVGVENVPAIFEQWQIDSAKARTTLTYHADLRYGDANREILDLFPAQSSNKWIVFIHGGYWRVMTKEYFSFLAPPFVKAGYNVALLEYDLCPAVTIHTITDQCRRGTAWLAHHAADYGLACDEIIVTGHSAGGHLTAMMFATNWHEYGMSPEKITGGIALSGLFDLDPISQTAMNADLNLSPVDVQALSPIRLDPFVNAPMVVTVGALESTEFHRQSRLIKAAPNWENIASELLILEGYHHFNILEPFMDMNHVMWKSLLEKR
jgi:arylformamidase